MQVGSQVPIGSTDSFAPDVPSETSLDELTLYNTIIFSRTGPRTGRAKSPDHLFSNARRPFPVSQSSRASLPSPSRLQFVDRLDDPAPRPSAVPSPSSASSRPLRAMFKSRGFALLRRRVATFSASEDDSPTPEAGS